ncbi:MAG: phage tail tape measure protein, partial [Clostridiales bacterium]|nr:phage tail tape measure protein [Clostridiales bacterium]
MPAFKDYQMMFQLNASTSGSFQSAFSGAGNAIMQLQSKIDALNHKQGDIAAYQKQQQAVERTKQRLETLRQQYENLRQAQEKAGGSSVDLQNKMLAKQLQIDKTSAALDQQTQKLDAMGNALNEAGVDTNNLGDASAALKNEIDGLKEEQMEAAESAEEMGASMGDAVSAMGEALVAAGIVEGLKALMDAMKQCADAAIEYETAMAGVQRTVGGGESFISGLGDRFKELSTEIPITATELAGIATTAGQLGIAQNNVEQFTQVMAQLATTTDLTADDAATMLAQFANITGTTEYDRLGSTIAQLGDATATTASKVVQMSQGMAASASLAGFSETDILAVSAAVGSLGIEAQAGSTAMSTLISTLYKAVETGDGLENFASVANMTAGEFKQAWGQDAVGAMNAFIQGLNDTERNGKSAVVILDELGITNVRQTKAILGLASAGDLLSGTIAQANEAWESNTALTEKAGIMYGTTEARLTMMQNAANNVKIAIGDAFTGAMASLADAITPVLQGIAEFIERNPGVVQAITTVIGVIGAAVGGIMALSAALKIGAAAAALMSAAIPGLPIILGVVGGVAALAG